MYPKTILFAIVTVMAVSTAASAVTATETFDTGLGKFDLVVGVPGGDNDFGFSNTSYAGGDAGELGGTIARSDVARYVADGTLGGTLTTNDEIKMSGQFKLNDINFDGRFFFGYFDTATITDFERPSPGLGLWFYEPGGGSGDSFRLRICAGGVATEGGAPPHAPSNQVVNFNLTFTPSGNDDGSGTLLANINGEEVTVNVGSNEDIYNAFGLVVGFVGSSRADKATAYFDNLEYTVFVLEGNAYSPSPADGRIDVPRDVILSWTPGEFADKHDVYFGTVFDDVNEASGTNPLGVLVGQNQDANSYDPAGLLDFGQTYYWRVDEVKAAPDYTIFKGDIWSFTVEPFAYMIAGENIIATASSSDPSKGPENTVNGSGLDDSGLLHGNAGENNMWLSSMTGPQPTWIEFQFDNVYKLHEMWVWNSNESLEPAIGLGFKDVSIEYSADGTEYTTLGTTHEFARAPGAPGYAHNTTIDFGGAAAKYVRLTANSNWGGILNQYGLSEVRFFYLSVQAREPKPASGETGIYPDVVLSWRAGREADTHDVYLSTSEQEVINDSAPVATVSEPSYDAGTLDLGRTYYWRIDEVNGAETPATWQGEVWNFATAEYLVVDDFESYNDLDPTDPGSNRIFSTWIDGYDIPTNGSVVGYSQAPFAEQTFVHGGHQAMPFSYDNTGTARVSEAVASIANLESGYDWTRAGITTLTLYFQGNTGNTIDQMYVKVNGVKVVYDGDPSTIVRQWWTQWNIDLTSLGVNLQNVTQLAIGFGDPARTTPGGKGLVFFDDIRLYRSAPELPGEMIWLDAEAADNLGTRWRLYDDPAAWGRKYIGSENGDGNHNNNPPGADWIASYNFTAAGGIYKVMLRVKTDSDSFWVRITGATNLTPGEDPANAGTGWVRFNGMPAGGTWHWVDVFSSDHNDTVANWTLPAGPHTLEIAKREDGVWLDAILITDKLD